MRLLHCLYLLLLSPLAATAPVFSNMSVGRTNTFSTGKQSSSRNIVVVKASSLPIEKRFVRENLVNGVGNHLKVVLKRFEDSRSVEERKTGEWFVEKI